MRRPFKRAQSLQNTFFRGIHSIQNLIIFTQSFERVNDNVTEKFRKKILQTIHQLSSGEKPSDISACKDKGSRGS